MKNPGNGDTKIALMLVDDHFIVRQGLAGAFARDPLINVVAECDSGLEAVEAYRDLRPDVVLMDWRLPGMSGLEATRAILAEFPDARIIALTAFEGEEDIHKAVDAGVAGYLPKSVRRGDLIAAIHDVHQGKEYFPPDVTAKLAERRSRQPLNEKELTILKGVAAGLANKSIAADLNVAEVTVKYHVGSILRKLSASDRTHAVMIAIQRGILHWDG
jgi:two-component system, NarL family, response regulator